MLNIIRKLFNTKKLSTCTNILSDEQFQNKDVSSKLSENNSILLEVFRNSTDIIFAQIESIYGINMLLVYVDGLINKDQVNRDVVMPFVSHAKDSEIKKILFVSEISEQNSLSKAVDEVLAGNAVMFLDGANSAYILNTKGWDKRTIEPPDSETVIRGPKEGFIESIRINTALLRRKIQNPNLVIEKALVGKQTKTKIEIAYIDGIVNQDVLNIVKERISEIDTDSVLDSGYIEQFIDESNYSLFATLGNSQKPDVVAGKILEGRVAIFVDGSPHVLTAPYLFIENFQTSEDYYWRPILASFLRVLRFLAFALSTLTPALYVAFQNYHQEMIPPTLLLSMSASREGLPLPAIAESFFMTLMFELIRESGTRLPRMVGPAISIVGALVIGQAAVDAGFVSGPMVVVIAVTAVSSFILSSMIETMLILRFSLMIIGGILGLYGMAGAIFVVATHAVSLRSFGINYTSAIAPLEMNGFKDYFLRLPLWSMRQRPASIAKNNTIRQGNINRRY